MENDYISRAVAVQCARDISKDFENEGFSREAGGAQTVGDWLEDAPAADVVSRNAFNRILAENDDMRAQLAQIGKKPGDSMDDVRRVTPTVNYDDPYKPLWPHWDD